MAIFGISWFTGCFTPISASIFTRPSSLCVSNSLLLSLIRTSVIGFRAHSQSGDSLILRSLTTPQTFPDKVTFHRLQGFRLGHSLLGVITQPTKERNTLRRKIAAALIALQATAIIHCMLQNSLCLVICITSYL